jgi:predicted ATPase
VLQNPEFAVLESGGVAEVRNKILRQREQPKPLMIGVKISAPDLFVESGEGDSYLFTQFDYTLTLDLRGMSGVPVIESENLTAAMQDGEGRALNYAMERSKHNVVIRDPTARSQSQEYVVPPQEATRLALGVGFYSLPCVVLRTVIEGWRFYDIDPRQARLPCKETPDVDLGRSGENLAVILHKLEQQNGKGALDTVVSGLRGAVPGFRGIKTTQLPVEGKWAFQVLEEKIRGAMNPDSISDGTIRLLALLVIAHWKARSSGLIAIEEPENGIHPYLSEYIVEILRTASEERQHLITTHNPSFLDYLEPDEVILCDKIDGFTTLRRASDIAQIETFRKHFRLGELWEQGTLGGIP